MPDIFDPDHPAFALTPEQSHRYLLWSERLAYALAILLGLAAVILGKRQLAASLLSAAVFFFFARQLSQGKTDSAIGLLLFAVGRLFATLLGIIHVPTLFALAEITVFGQGARGAIALKRPLPVDSETGRPLAQPRTSVTASPPETGWTSRVRFDLATGVVLIVVSITSFTWLFQGVPSSGYMGGPGILLIVGVQLIAILLGLALIVAAFGGMSGGRWVPMFRWIIYLVIVGGILLFGQLVLVTISARVRGAFH